MNGQELSRDLRGSAGPRFVCPDAERHDVSAGEPKEQVAHRRHKCTESLKGECRDQTGHGIVSSDLQLISHADYEVMVRRPQFAVSLDVLSIGIRCYNHGRLRFRSRETSLRVEPRNAPRFLRRIHSSIRTVSGGRERALRMGFVTSYSHSRLRFDEGDVMYPNRISQ